MFEWTLAIIEGGGYVGIFLLMVLENIFPPIPSELVIPLAGFAAAKGDLSLVGVVVATTLGGIVGALPWYFLGRLYGLRRLKQLSLKYGRLLTLTPSDIDAAQVWFKKHGNLTVFFGRLMPTIRTLISVPAGIAHMPFLPFVVYSALGTFIWNCLLLFSGYILESQYEKLAGPIDVLSNVIVLLLFAIYIYRVVTYKKEAVETAS